MYKSVSPGNIGHGLTFRDAAEAVSKVGFEGYTFSAESDFAVSVSETKELLARNNLKPSGFGLPVEFRAEQDVFDKDFAKLKTFAKYAADIGETRCFTWIMPFHDTLDFAANFELHRSRLKKCTEVLKEYGIFFGMEFVGPPKMRKGVKHEFIHNLEGLLELCAAIGTGNCGILMDTYHWDLAGHTREDFAKFTSPQQVVIAHINDALAGIPAEEQEDTVRKLPGETGVLRIGEFFDGLKSIGYDGPVLAEPFEEKLSQMTFEEALNATMSAMNKVWPKNF